MSARSDGTWHTCGKCGTDMWLPQSLYETAKRSPGKIGFFCPYGHERVFVDGESEAQKLRRERDRLAQQIAQRDDEIKQIDIQRQVAEKRAEAAVKAKKRIEKRASAGTCPCCNRNFLALSRHLANKHPEFVKESEGPKPDQKVVPLPDRRTA